MRALHVALMRVVWWCRYSDYYNCGFSLATREVEGTFLMSFTLMGRPYPVTQHPKDAATGLSGRSCTEQPHRCCGADSHDSHYVTVRKKGDYYPCPPREQPDFDEVVVFKPEVVLPAASFEFKRRRRTLLWLDDRPDRNKRVLMQFPGCPQQPHLYVDTAYPMRQHCSACKHGLTLDSNPFGTVATRKKAAKAAAAAYSAAVRAAEDAPSAEATQKEEECQRALAAAEALVEQAQPAADDVPHEVRGRDIKLEEQVGRARDVAVDRVVMQEVVQVDVVLFTRVEDMTAFMRVHPELSKCAAFARFCCLLRVTPAVAATRPLCCASSAAGGCSLATAGCSSSWTATHSGASSFPPHSCSTATQLLT